VLFLVVIAANAALIALIAFPEPLFCCYTERGRLSLYSDEPFNPARAQALLDGIDARLRRSPLDHGEPAAIFISNADWRQRLLMNIAYGAGGVNFYPLTRNVFLRNADIDADTLYGRSGRPTERPRTLSYFAAHEIGHSLTGESLGMWHIWNWRSPVWIREGSADFIGFGGRVGVAELYSRFRAHDPVFNPASGHYDRYRLLTAYFLLNRHWPMERLLSSNITMPDAEKMMNADLGRNPANAGTERGSVVKEQPAVH